MTKTRESPEGDVWNRMTITERVAILKHVTSFSNRTEAILDYIARDHSLNGGYFTGSQRASIRHWIKKFGLV